MYTMPWTVPAPIGILVSTGFAPLAFVFVLLTLVLDVLIYFPFIRVYDRTLLAEEKAKEDVIEGQDTAVLAADTVAPQTAEASEMVDKKPAAAHDESFFKNNEIDVLVLCAGGGTSGILANALNKLSKERG